MRILLVEDEPKTASYLTKGLTENGFIVDTAHDGDEGLFAATSMHYDLIVLDVMLPKRDGWSVLTQLRHQACLTPVLFLSAKDTPEDRVKGLELGADDFLVKPFSFSELLARMHKILRRGQKNTLDKLVLEDLTVDLLRHQATRAGMRLPLTPKEFALLSLLIRRKGQVISRTVIAEQVWDIHFDTDTNVVDVAIRRLRQKMDIPFERKLLHTLRGVGYVLEARE